jgi:hypothetical protein
MFSVNEGKRITQTNRLLWVEDGKELCRHDTTLVWILDERRPENEIQHMNGVTLTMSPHKSELFIPVLFKNVLNGTPQKVADLSVIGF